MDCCRVVELESRQLVELLTCWTGLRSKRGFPPEEFISGTECDGQEDESNLTGGGGAVARGPCYCDQDIVLCVSFPLLYILYNP